MIVPLLALHFSVRDAGAQQNSPPVFVAQTLPFDVDPGRIKPITPLKTYGKDQESLPESREDDTQGQQHDGPDISFFLSAIGLEGASVYSVEELAPLFQNYLGKEVSLRDVQDIADSIEAKYRRDGYILTNVVLPSQEIREGRVRILVVEGFIDRVLIESEQKGGPFSYDRERIMAYAEIITKSRPVDIKDMERALLLIGDLPGLEVSSVIKPSPSVPGAADLVLLLDQDPVSASVSINNRGSESLGPFRNQVNIEVNSLTGRSENTEVVMLSTLGVAQEGELYYFSVDHQEAIGGSGLKAGLHVSYTDSEQGGELEILEIEGASYSYVLNANYPVLRSRKKNFYVNGSLGYFTNETTLLSETITDDRLWIATLGMDYSFESAAFGGETTLSANIAQGLPVFDASGVEDENLSRFRGESDFTKFNFALTHQRLMGLWSFSMGIDMQLTGDRLLSSEEYGIGGDVFGRAFDSSAIVGDQGLSGFMELGYYWLRPTDFIDYIQPYVFVDGGKVWNTDDAPEGGIASTGFGIRLSAFEAGWVDGLVGHPLAQSKDEREQIEDVRFFIRAGINF